MATPEDRPEPPGDRGDVRPDPDAADTRGRFHVYLGAAPGVGKTWAMLDEGHRRKLRGADVAVGFVECHGRQSVEELVEGLEVVRRKDVTYRGSHFQEMDVDTVLDRRPQVVLVDELAHTNVPGSGPHEKRWQDVVQLLDAGIGVITTLNVQHLESIAAAVEGIIEVPVRERVPDEVVRRADQIELVDASPEHLRRRLLRGGVYSPEQTEGALSHYFRADNLAVLRELALRFLSGETEAELLEYLHGKRRDAVPDTPERILVGVTAAPGAEFFVGRASRMAVRFRADLDALHVLAPKDSHRPPDERLAALRQVVDDVGGRWHQVLDDDPAQAIMEFARRRHVTQIVVGSSARSRWRELLGGGSIVRKISRLAAAEAIDVHIIARRADVPEVPPAPGSGPAPGAGSTGGPPGGADPAGSGTAVEPAVGIEPTT